MESYLETEPKKTLQLDNIYREYGLVAINIVHEPFRYTSKESIFNLSSLIYRVI